MRHARRDYARIQDPWNKIGEEEPVFLIRGQDILFCDILQAYMDAYAKQEKADPNIIKQLAYHLDYAEEWSALNDNRLKVADAPKEDCGCEPIKTTRYEVME
ncbi:MAG TPA: hypothetical protein VGA01_12145 [Candidatus Binatia bacterium]